MFLGTHLSFCSKTPLLGLPTASLGAPGTPEAVQTAPRIEHRLSADRSRNMGLGVKRYKGKPKGIASPKNLQEKLEDGWPESIFHDTQPG